MLLINYENGKRIAEIARPTLRLLQEEVQKGTLEITLHEKEVPTSYITYLLVGKVMVPQYHNTTYTDQWFSIVSLKNDKKLLAKIHDDMEGISRLKHCCAKVGTMRGGDELCVLFTAGTDMLFSELYNITQKKQRGK
jgi:hypothetical protein